MACSPPTARRGMRIGNTTLHRAAGMGRLPKLLLLLLWCGPGCCGQHSSIADTQLGQPLIGAGEVSGQSTAGSAPWWSRSCTSRARDPSLRELEQGCHPAHIPRLEVDGGLATTSSWPPPAAAISGVLPTPSWTSRRGRGRGRLHFRNPRRRRSLRPNMCAGGPRLSILWKSQSLERREGAGKSSFMVTARLQADSSASVNAM